ncbi:alpha/beta hydrolase family protein [Promicromonospora sukumoe]|uniref:alpha/beta hydrolase family protein n=1 Tax=Promicromonospora sukumoe TaxID=88382 RepID=UPI00036D92AA|nr:alpha/beta hydrolase [Promicromonospora sukumoe]
MVEIVASSGSVTLSGTLWLPDDAPTALLVMHPGSGPSDRHNDVYFPPIRNALLAAGVAVAAFDKRGVGGSTGSWLAAGIEDQADDLLAGLAAAVDRVPGVPAGVFGHSQGGWVVLEACRRAGLGSATLPGPRFAVTSSGPAVSVIEQERYSVRNAVRALPEADRASAVAAADQVLDLMRDGAPHADLTELLSAYPAEAEGLAGVWGISTGITAEEWTHLVLVGAYDPLPALRSLSVPLLAAFGGDDPVTPSVASVEVLRREVAAGLLSTEVLAGGNHRMAAPGAVDDGAGPGAFVPGFPEVVVEFAVAQAKQGVVGR